MNSSYNVAPNASDNFPVVNPIGSMLLWPTLTPPANYLVCDGSAVSRTLYNVLFSVLGSFYGAGDGTTTFNIPNTSGRNVRGVGAGFVIGATQGADTVNLIATDLPFHGHLLNDPQHFHNSVQRGIGFAAADGNNGNRCDANGTTESSSTGITVIPSLTDANGVGIPGNSRTLVNTQNPLIVLNYIIRAT
jgi:microcystin-dependent protein